MWMSPDRTGSPLCSEHTCYLNVEPFLKSAVASTLFMPFNAIALFEGSAAVVFPLTYLLCLYPHKRPSIIMRCWSVLASCFGGKRTGPTFPCNTPPHTHTLSISTSRKGPLHIDVVVAHPFSLLILGREKLPVYTYGPSLLCCGCSQGVCVYMRFVQVV